MSFYPTVQHVIYMRDFYLNEGLALEQGGLNADFEYEENTSLGWKKEIELLAKDVLSIYLNAQSYVGDEDGATIALVERIVLSIETITTGLNNIKGGKKHLFGHGSRLAFSLLQLLETFHEDHPALLDEHNAKKFFLNKISDRNLVEINQDLSDEDAKDYIDTHIITQARKIVIEKFSDVYKPKKQLPIDEIPLKKAKFKLPKRLADLFQEGHREALKDKIQQCLAQQPGRDLNAIDLVRYEIARASKSEFNPTKTSRVFASGGYFPVMRRALEAYFNSISQPLGDSLQPLETVNVAFALQNRQPVIELESHDDHSDDAEEPQRRSPPPSPASDDTDVNPESGTHNFRSQQRPASAKGRGRGRQQGRDFPSLGEFRTMTTEQRKQRYDFPSIAASTGSPIHTQANTSSAETIELRTKAHHHTLPPIQPPKQQ